MQLSQKQKSSSQFFAQFVKFSLNLEHFETKDYPHTFCFSESTEAENVVK